METLSFRLECRARKCWKSMSGPLLHEQGYVSWPDFRNPFKNLYFPPALRQENASELLSLNQEDLTVEEYQQNFYDLLSFCPHINESLEAKYSHFLQGLNHDIYEMVSVCDDPTSYEGLVNRCRQDEHTIARRKSLQASRVSSSLGPRAQSFKNPVTSSSSGSGGHGKKKFQCELCGRNHPIDIFQSAIGACFRCGEVGHLKRDCPQMSIGSGSGSGSQSTIQQRTHGSLRRGS